MWVACTSMFSACREALPETAELAAYVEAAFMEFQALPAAEAPPAPVAKKAVAKKAPARKTAAKKPVAKATPKPRASTARKKAAAG
jgi:hypothetical protein